MMVTKSTYRDANRIDTRARKLIDVVLSEPGFPDNNWVLNINHIDGEDDLPVIFEYRVNSVRISFRECTLIIAIQWSR